MSFTQGLHIQCAFTPLLAIMHQATIFEILKLEERNVRLISVPRVVRTEVLRWVLA